MERLSKSLDKTIKQHDEMSDQLDKKNDNINQVMGLSEFSQIIEIIKSQKETDIRAKLADAVSRGTSLDSISASIIKDAQFIQALDNYGSGSVGGGASAAASKASGGYF